MSEALSEDDMRRALFGNSAPPSEEIRPHQPRPTGTLSPAEKPAQHRRLSSRLRVTLRVAKEFEGPTELFVHDANTLSSLIAEGEAKAAARKKKFRYFEVVSIQSVQV
ncbi:hypothetical protein U8291_13720 [Pseudomonas sp. A2]|uniref:hypothetical protein n=1 Tax=Pseudomonas sp. A2 TaxID=107445 RepID=UPI002BAE9FE3|nr:hypothetical protein [Pseudomonas sp. A2]MEB3438073.1 hypothetical protein [Pseudomonas sp. A2]